MGELAAEQPADHGGLLVVDDEPFLRDAVADAHHGTADARLDEPHGLRVTLAVPAAALLAVAESG